LGGYCAETNEGGTVTSTVGKEWVYNTIDCTVYVRAYTGGVGSSCVGEHVTPVGTEVSSFDHTEGTLTPTGINRLFDTGIRYIDSNNKAIAIVVEWNDKLTQVERVWILCDCSFEGDVTENFEEG
jgi:hypothetical protein